MKKILLTIALLSLLTVGLHAEVSTMQTPVIQISFTCNQTAPKCTEFLRLVSNGLGWTAESGLTRNQFVQKETANRLIRIAVQQRKSEDAKTAIDAAEAAVQADFPEQP